MSFKRKLLIATSIVTILPILAFAVSFLVIGNMMNGSGGVRGFQKLLEERQEKTQQLDVYFNELTGLCDGTGNVLDSVPALEEFASGMEAGYNLILRSDGKLVFARDEKAAKEVFDRLPPQGNERTADGAGFYISRLDLLVKQMDFSCSDGRGGSVFVTVGMGGINPRRFVMFMFYAVIIILLGTAFLMTNWIKASVFEPVNQLKVAMNCIRDGNFDYRLATTEKGEIGELYQNYEDMRLRLKESAEEKVENEKHDRELISNIAHDLKTPITSIKGYADGLLDGVANTPEKQQKYLRTIYNKANDMNNLINELTLYSKIDANRIPYSFQKINLGDYFADCVSEIGMDLESRGIELNYSNLVSPDTLIIADPEQLKRVINNIISNSVKYMDKPKGRIDIRILDEQDSVRIEIEDNGKGIAQRDLPNIFERFYRTDSSRNSAQGGSGIGLSIVKKIIEDHGGYIWATSDEGRGTCLHFVLRKYREKEFDADSVVDSTADTVERA